MLNADCSLAGLGSWLGGSSKSEEQDPEKVVTQPGYSSSLHLSIADEARLVTSVVVSPRYLTSSPSLLFEIIALLVSQSRGISPYQNP